MADPTAAGAGVPTTPPESDDASEASPGPRATDEVLGMTDLVEAITSLVAEGDVLCWALAGPALGRRIRGHPAAF